MMIGKQFLRKSTNIFFTYLLNSWFIAFSYYLNCKLSFNSLTIGELSVNRLMIVNHTAINQICITNVLRVYLLRIAINYPL